MFACHCTVLVLGEVSYPARELGVIGERKLCPGSIPKGMELEGGGMPTALGSSKGILGMGIGWDCWSSKDPISIWLAPGGEETGDDDARLIIPAPPMVANCPLGPAYKFPGSLLSESESSSGVAVPMLPAVTPGSVTGY